MNLASFQRRATPVLCQHLRAGEISKCNKFVRRHSDGEIAMSTTPQENQAVSAFTNMFSLLGVCVDIVFSLKAYFRKYYACFRMFLKVNKALWNEMQPIGKTLPAASFPSHGDAKAQWASHTSHSDVPRWKKKRANYTQRCSFLVWLFGWVPAGARGVQRLSGGASAMCSEDRVTFKRWWNAGSRKTYESVTVRKGLKFWAF